MFDFCVKEQPIKKKPTAGEVATIWSAIIAAIALFINILQFYIGTTTAVPRGIDAASPSSDRIVAYTADLIHDGADSDAVALIESRCALRIDGELHKAVLLYNEGVAEYQSGHRDSAKMCFQAAIDTAAFPEVYYSLGVIFYYEGNYSEAINNYTRAIELDEQECYYLARAMAYEKYGQPNEAEHDRQYVREKKLDLTV